MKTKIYLVVSESGRVDVRKRYPELCHDEIAIRLELEVPDGLFQRPQLEALVQVPNVEAPHLDLGVLDLAAAQEALEAAIKRPVVLRIVPTEEKEKQ